MKKRYKMFVFGETLQKAIDQLPETEQLRFYRMIVRYGIDGVAPELTGLEAAVWVQMKDMIDNTMPAQRGAPQGNANANAKQKNNSDELFQQNQFDLIETNETNETIKDELFQQNQFDLIETNAAMYNENENDNDNANEKEKENGESPPSSFSPFSETAAINQARQAGQADPRETGPPEKNYAKVFEAAKARWQEVTGQETKETLFTVSPAKRERFVNALAVYSLEDIFNAIENYWHTKNHPEQYDINNRIYGNLVGFLENGVSQFYSDDMVKANFRRQ
jgi:hypothetical protein